MSAVEAVPSYWQGDRESYDRMREGLDANSKSVDGRFADGWKLFRFSSHRTRDRFTAAVPESARLSVYSFSWDNHKGAYLVAPEHWSAAEQSGKAVKRTPKGIRPTW